ncbi:MAG: hypothetical protein IJ399_04155 [Bacilli bacterium]|nr:hypothetical protein [Bacilli bacterium]
MKNKETKLEKIYDFDFDDRIQEKLNISIAIELIRKYLFNTNLISKEEMKNVINTANRSVKNKNILT